VDDSLFGFPIFRIGADAYSGATVADFHRVPVWVSQSQRSETHSQAMNFRKSERGEPTGGSENCQGKKMCMACRKGARGWLAVWLLVRAGGLGRRFAGFRVGPPNPPGTARGVL